MLNPKVRMGFYTLAWQPRKCSHLVGFCCTKALCGCSVCVHSSRDPSLDPTGRFHRSHSSLSNFVAAEGVDEMQKELMSCQVDGLIGFGILNAGSRSISFGDGSVRHFLVTVYAHLLGL